MLHMTAAGKAHGHETRQRCSLEKPAVRRLDAPQDFQSARYEGSAESIDDGVAGRRVMMFRLADRDERGQRITDDRKAQHRVKLPRKCRQLKRKLNDFIPGITPCAE